MKGRRATRAPGGFRALLCACVGAGAVVVFLETGLQPVVQKSLVAALERPEATGAGKVALLLALLFAARAGGHAATLLSQILQGILIGRRIAVRKLALFRRLLLAPAAFHAEVEPEKAVERIETGTAESVPFFTTVLLSVPMASLALAWSLWQMLCGTPSALLATGWFSPQRPHPGLAALAVLAAGGVVAAVSLFEGRRTRLHREARSADEDARSRETEALRGVQDLRGAGAFPFALGRIAAAVETERRTGVRFQALLTLFSGAGGLAFCLAEVAVLGGAARLIFRPGTDFAYSDYVGFAALCGSFNASALSLWGVWQDARRALLARRRLRAYETLPDAYGPRPFRIPPGGEDASSAWTFRCVSFSVPDGTTVLRDVELRVEPGEHVAIVGPSGCGKSTLLKIAARHLEPSSGSILYQGTQVPDWPHAEFARRVAYVPQKPFLFDGTLRENVLLGREPTVSDDRLLRLADAVGLLGDLRRRAPDPACALDLPVGAEGRAVSGGQSAKIALLRALSGDPAALLLDEITAPLDELSQARVSRLLSESFRDRTILSVSHRLPAVRGMDRIVVMDAGRIVQDGSWEALSSSPGLFARLLARETGAADGPSEASGTERAVSGPSEIVRALSLSPVFADLDALQIARLAACAETVRAPAGTFLFRAGDAGDSLFVISDGGVFINGRSYGPGHAFGEIALFSGLRRTADVRVTADSAFVRLHRDDVLSAVRSSPDLAVRLLAALSRIAARA